MIVQGTVQQLQAFRDLIASELTARQKRRVLDWVVDVSRQPNEAVIELEFDTLAQADAVRDWFRDHRNQIRQIGVIGIAKGYLCSHDDVEVFSCSADPRAQYREMTFGS